MQTAADEGNFLARLAGQQNAGDIDCTADSDGHNKAEQIGQGQQVCGGSVLRMCERSILR